MGKRKGSSSASRPRTRSKAAEERRIAKEVESVQRLEKLPQELWEKILDHLDENDLFTLALSCRRFRQKQKELVARARQSGPESRKPRLTLRTNLQRKIEEGQLASADYLRFCSKEKYFLWRKCDIWQKAHFIKCLAAFHGHLPLLQELSNTDFFNHKPYVIDIYEEAVRGGQLETLQWLRTQKAFELDAELFNFACESGNMEFIRWLRSEGCPWDATACAGAAKGGHLEILKWLKSEGCPWDDEWTCDGAAAGGHLEILKWLRSKGCSWDEGAWHGAALGGHWEILKYLRSEGCPWDEGACSSAAQEGHLEILKWLRSEGCPWDAMTVAVADDCGHDDVYEWAIDNGCPDLFSMYD